MTKMSVSSVRIASCRSASPS